ncbi:MAG: hypothetical protein D6715_02220 [Calditrichaeota bacterium]|nr:MAG: hypothetical protein D6715_02220 [Calditrichota bacterium]
MRNNLLTTLLFLLVLAFSAVAGSVFSSSPQGFGLKSYLVSVRGMGMGGTGLVNPDTVSLSFYTVSQWRFIKITRGMVGFQYNRQASEYQNIDFTTATGTFGGMALAIPMKRHQWVLGISLQPYSRADFRYVLTKPLGETTFNQSVLVDGNLSKAQLALIYSPHPRLGLSASAFYYFGNFREEFRFMFQDLEHNSDTYQIEYEVYGPGLGLSADYRLSHQFHFAGYVDFKPSLNNRQVINTTVLDTSLDLPGLESVPLQFGLGVQVLLSPQWRAALDFSHQDLKKTTVSAKANLDRWYHLGFGVEHLNGGRRAKKFLNKFDSRAGFSVSRLGYRFDNDPVYEYGFHLGLGIPFFAHINRLDLAFVGGWRGDKSANKARETFLRIDVSVSVGERWFRRLDR